MTTTADAALTWDCPECYAGGGAWTALIAEEAPEGITRINAMVVTHYSEAHGDIEAPGVFTMHLARTQADLHRRPRPGADA